MPDVEAQIEMPRYKSHKVVHALKIKEVIVHDPPEGGSFEGAFLMPEDMRYAPIQIDAAWFCKHEPSGSGYYVVYPDGYKSWSPVEAFEQGYAVLPSRPGTTTESPGPERMLKWFAYSHLPEKLQAASKPFCDLAEDLVGNTQSGPERTVALRKLLEAKDAAVRATLNPGC